MSAAAGDDDAALLAACESFLAVDRELADTHGSDLEDEAISGPLFDRWYDALGEVAAIRPRTQAGCMAKARVAYLALKSTGNGTQREEAAALSALADVCGEAGA
jgi:hypothetical protein